MLLPASHLGQYLSVLIWLWVRLCVGKRACYNCTVVALILNTAACACSGNRSCPSTHTPLNAMWILYYLSPPMLVNIPCAPQPFFWHGNQQAASAAVRTFPGGCSHDSMRVHPFTESLAELKHFDFETGQSSIQFIQSLLPTSIQSTPHRLTHICIVAPKLSPPTL